MGKWADRIYMDLVARGKREPTARIWRVWVERFEDANGEKDSYSREDVLRYLLALRELKVKQNSINTMLKPIKLLWQVLDLGSFPRLSMVKVRKEDIDRPVFSVDDIKQMIVVGKEKLLPNQLADLALATTYGLRRAEMCELDREDMLSNGHVKIKTLKGGQTVSQVIPNEIREYLKGYEQMSIGGMNHMFDSICSKTGLKDRIRYGWHSIRRSLATELVMKEASIINIIRFMRWSDKSVSNELGMLAIYAMKDQDAIDRQIFSVHPFPKVLE